MSIVEQTLTEDSGDVYTKMDFATRDRYRHVVEKIAKSSSHSESEVARQAIQLAHEGATRQGSDHRSAHVGFYLIDEGVTRLERTAQVRLSPAEALRKVGSRFALQLYIGTILLMTAVFAGFLAAKAHAGGVQGWTLGLLGLLLLLCAGHLAVALVNWLATVLATPQRLPRMDFSKGIPSEFRTLVVVPTMLVSKENIEDLDREPGSPLPGKSGRLPALRPADRFSRRPRGNAAGGRTAVAAGPAENRRAERKVPEFGPAIIFSFFIARAAGTPRTGSGWVTSASAGSLRI